MFNLSNPVDTFANSTGGDAKAFGRDLNPVN